MDIEKPAKSASNGLWGSDALAEMLRRLDVPYVALNPGSSFRGLHDSLVNHLGNERPKMLLCLHEEHAVAIAHGYAKASGKPMAAILHANVGLMHATMAIYNAWCDRAPVLVYGATGPVDAAARRPWIDWIHTSQDQAALVRPYVKWDNQPASLQAALDAMMRAATVARTEPQGPTYVCFDVSLQEARLEAPPAMPDPARHAPPPPPAAPACALNDLAARLAAAERPVFLMGRTDRDAGAWARRVALAERFGARVATDIKTPACFPTDHPLHAGPPSFFLSDDQAHALRDADLIVSFDWIDPAGAVASAGKADAPLVAITLDHQLANGWALDHMAQPAAALRIAARPDDVIAALCDHFGIEPGDAPSAGPCAPAFAHSPAPGPISGDAFAAALGDGLRGETVCLARLPLGWAGESWRFRHPLDYLGYDGGAGIGSGPGMLIGAALALRGSGRLAVGVLGDGDLMMGASALWTAARYRIPMLAVIANNRSFFNDEIHQEKVARARGRATENKWIGQAIAGPDIDLAAIARAQGLEAFGPVEAAGDLADAVREGAALAKAGASVLIDARIEPGYASTMAKGMTEEG